MGGALLGPLIGPSADVLGGLGLDQRLQPQGQRLADDVQVAAGTQCIQQLGQGRLAEGHRGGLLGVNLGRITLSFTRWPLALLLSRARACLKVHHHLRRLLGGRPELVRISISCARRAGSGHQSFAVAARLLPEDPSHRLLMKQARRAHPA